MFIVIRCRVDDVAQMTYPEMVIKPPKDGPMAATGLTIKQIYFGVGTSLTLHFVTIVGSVLPYNFLILFHQVTLRSLTYLSI